MQNNHASGTQKHYTQNKLKQLISPGLLASCDLWSRNSMPILKGKGKYELYK